MMRRLAELLRERRRARREIARMKSLSREETCPGCGIKGPWIALFIHPLCPAEDLHKPCDYCEQMPLHVKFSRIAALSSLGVPLSERIIRNVMELTFKAAEEDDPTVNWDMIVTVQNAMRMSLMEDGWDGEYPPNPIDSMGSEQQPHKPATTDHELPLEDRGNWHDWDMDN
jgi:hypothetical protein